MYIFTRFYLSVAGIVSVFKGLAISVAVASLLDFPYTPMHAALPFLCLGMNFVNLVICVELEPNIDSLIMMLDYIHVLHYT